MSITDDDFDLKQLTLGKTTDYHSSYEPKLLQAVPRAINRQELGIVNSQPFFGEDIWHGYELSWLSSKGKPNIALMRCAVPYSSPNLIESKSFKLYLNSFNQSRFTNADNVREYLERDLSAIAGFAVEVQLFGPEDFKPFESTALPGSCIDQQDIEINSFHLNTTILTQGQVDEASAEHQKVSETLHSHLLKSNCLVTNQPDWASVIIQYKGKKICQEALLKYLISFRMHNEFHEQCVERIFVDIMNAYSPEQLSVQALYTRRGGLDINPFRSSDESERAPQWRINRQ